MRFQQQQPAPVPSPAPGPVIVETIRQPPVTREITMGDVVVGAVGFVGFVMIVAPIAGLLLGLVVLLRSAGRRGLLRGLVVVVRKGARDRVAGPTDPGHARLRG